MSAYLTKGSHTHFTCAYASETSYLPLYPPFCPSWTGIFSHIHVFALHGWEGDVWWLFNDYNYYLEKMMWHREEVKRRRKSKRAILFSGNGRQLFVIGGRLIIHLSADLTEWDDWLMNFVVYSYIIIVTDVVWLELCEDIVMMPTIFGLATF